MTNEEPKYAHIFFKNGTHIVVPHRIEKNLIGDLRWTKTGERQLEYLNLDEVAAIVNTTTPTEIENA